MSFLSTAKFFVPLSIALTIVSLVLLVKPGPRLSIEFTGGTLIELAIPAATKEDLSTTLENISFTDSSPLGNFSLTTTVTNTYLIRTRDLSNKEHLQLTSQLQQSLGELSEKQFTTIGPTVGTTLKIRSIWSLVLASIAIILYIAFAFRKVPKQLSPWKFGIIAVGTLLHDVMITVGLFVILSHTTSFEVDTLFVTALLTILGYSVNDTIVIFDRIRDNLNIQHRGEEFVVVAERSLRESITRSLNTSLATLIVLLTLFFLGSESIKWFALTLIVGIVLGTYSSLFVAVPLLVYWKKRQ